MTRVAFAPSLSFVGSRQTRLLLMDAKGLRFGKRRVFAKPWRASSIPEPEQSGGMADDDALSLELRNKVNELFGSRQNVTIEMETDSGVQFNVRKTDVEAEYGQSKAAWSVIGSIAVLSVVAGIAFIALYTSGAVHGSKNERRYDMPTYGKNSYINPYELLEEDRQFQDARALPEE